MHKKMGCLRLKKIPEPLTKIGGAPAQPRTAPPAYTYRHRTTPTHSRIQTKDTRALQHSISGPTTTAMQASSANVLRELGVVRHGSDAARSTWGRGAVRETSQR